MKCPSAIAVVLSLLSIAGCGQGSQAEGGGGGAGGTPGATAAEGAAGSGGTAGIDDVGGSGGYSGSSGSGGTGGAVGEPYQVCTLGLCLEDPEVGLECQEVYDACVGRGHYPRSCRMDADKTCGVFGETGPY